MMSEPTNTPQSSPRELTRSLLFVTIAFVISAFAFPMAQRLAATGARPPTEVAASSTGLSSEGTVLPATRQPGRSEPDRHSDLERLPAKDKLAIGLAAVAVVVFTGSRQALRQMR